MVFRLLDHSTYFVDAPLIFDAVGTFNLTTRICIPQSREWLEQSQRNLAGIFISSYR